MLLYTTLFFYIEPCVGCQPTVAYRWHDAPYMDLCKWSECVWATNEWARERDKEVKSMYVRVRMAMMMMMMIVAIAVAVLIVVVIWNCCCWFDCTYLLRVQQEDLVRMCPVWWHSHPVHWRVRKSVHLTFGVARWCPCTATIWRMVSHRDRWPVWLNRTLSVIDLFFFFLVHGDSGNGHITNVHRVQAQRIRRQRNRSRREKEKKCMNLMILYAHVRRNYRMQSPTSVMNGMTLKSWKYLKHEQPRSNDYFHR